MEGQRTASYVQHTPMMMMMMMMNFTLGSEGQVGDKFGGQVSHHPLGYRVGFQVSLSLILSRLARLAIGRRMHCILLTLRFCHQA